MTKLFLEQPRLHRVCERRSTNNFKLLSLDHFIWTRHLKFVLWRTNISEVYGHKTSTSAALVSTTWLLPCHGSDFTDGTEEEGKDNEGDILLEEGLFVDEYVDEGEEAHPDPHEQPGKDDPGVDVVVSSLLHSQWPPHGKLGSSWSVRQSPVSSLCNFSTDPHRRENRGRLEGGSRSDQIPNSHPLTYWPFTPLTSWAPVTGSGLFRMTLIFF